MKQMIKQVVMLLLLTLAATTAWAQSQSTTSAVQGTIADETGAVIVTRGTDTARLECAPVCRPRPDIGDSAASTAVNEQITTHAAVATASSH